MPCQERLGLHEEGVPGAARQNAAERRQEESVLGLDARPADLAAKDRQLMAEHEDLELLCAITAGDEHDQLKQAAERDVQR